MTPLAGLRVGSKLGLKAGGKDKEAKLAPGRRASSDSKKDEVIDDDR